MQFLVFRNLDRKLFSIHIVSGKILCTLHLYIYRACIKNIFSMIIAFECCKYFRPTSPVPTKLMQIIWSMWWSDLKKSGFTCISEILYKANFFQSLQMHRTEAQHSENSYYVPKFENHYKKKIEEKFECVPSNSYMAVGTGLLKCLEIS